MGFRSVKDLVRIVSDRRALKSALDHAMERLHFLEDFNILLFYEILGNK